MEPLREKYCLTKEQKFQLRKMLDLYLRYSLNDKATMFRVDETHFLFTFPSKYAEKKRSIYIDEDTMKEFNSRKEMIFLATNF
jgi:hypothetical protein